MIQTGRDPVKASQLADRMDNKTLVEAAFEQAASQLVPPPQLERPQGVHHTELQDKMPGEQLAEEWNTYRREIGRWLAEGQAGRHVLIKGEEIIGIFDSSDLAYASGHQRYPGQPFFVHPIRAEEPQLRIRGINYPWGSSLSR
jgi:hypothetical protein